MGGGAWLIGEAAAAHTNWLLLFIILGGIFLLMVALRILGLFLAATHPAATPREEPDEEALAEPAPGLDPKILAIIAATVSEVLTKPHRIVAVKKAPSVESLMQHWSMEGRRAIYTSHKFR